MEEKELLKRKKAQANKTATQIATLLGETEPVPLRQLYLLALEVSIEDIRELLQKTLDTEMNGGLYLQNGQRRTTGGVFFQYVREKYMGKLPTRILYGGTSKDPKKQPRPVRPQNRPRPPIRHNMRPRSNTVRRRPPFQGKSSERSNQTTPVP